MTASVLGATGAALTGVVQVVASSNGDAAAQTSRFTAVLTSNGNVYLSGNGNTVTPGMTGTSVTNIGTQPKGFYGPILTGVQMLAASGAPGSNMLFALTTSGRLMFSSYMSGGFCGLATTAQTCLSWQEAFVDYVKLNNIQKIVSNECAQHSMLGVVTTDGKCFVGGLLGTYSNSLGSARFPYGTEYGANQVNVGEPIVDVLFQESYRTTMYAVCYVQTASGNIYACGASAYTGLSNSTLTADSGYFVKLNLPAL